MDQLPADFAETLARVVEPGEEDAVASVIEAATQLDDEGLRVFLKRFATRVRSSPARVTGDELLRFLPQPKDDGF
jgi:hypothetical protein